LDKEIKTIPQLLQIIFGAESLSEVYSELLPYVLKPYAGNTEFANAPYLIVQSEDGSISIKRKADSSENAQIDEQMGDEGIASEKYETIAVDRHLNPATFYGMDIESGVFKSASYNGGSV
jgi:hypothetical protein